MQQSLPMSFEVLRREREKKKFLANKIQLGGKVQHPHRLSSQTRREARRRGIWGLSGERSLLGEEGSGCCAEGSGSGACGPWLNRVINVPANIRLAFGGNFIRLRSRRAAPASQPTSQPRTIVDIITHLIKHYNCKSTEICHGRLRHCGCPRQTRLFHSLSLCLFSKHSLLQLVTEETTEGGMESEKSKKDVEEFRMYGVSILETSTRNRSKLMHQV